MATCDDPVRSRSYEYNTLTITLGVISSLCAAQRLALKPIWKIGFGFYDYCMLAAAICNILSLIIKIYGVSDNGLGRDIWTLEPASVSRFGLFFFTLIVLYFAQVALLKLAILFFYLSIFPTPIIRELLWGTVIFNSLYGATFVLVAIFQCQPVHYFWTRWSGTYTGRCLDTNAITWSNAAISILLDIWMLAIPLSRLGALQMNWKKKVGVGMMFCVGALYDP